MTVWITYPLLEQMLDCRGRQLSTAVADTVHEDKLYRAFHSLVVSKIMHIPDPALCHLNVWKIIQTADDNRDRQLGRLKPPRRVGCYINDLWFRVSLP